MRGLARARAALTLGVVITAAAADAHAGGMYYVDRGVRPLGRGGAFVAGADDLGAMTYNPAGLADAGTSLLLDLAWVDVRTEFTRKAVVADSAGNETIVTSPRVEGKTPFLLIPTLGASFAPRGALDGFTFAAGIHAPYAAVSEYPTVADGQPAGSRYSLVSLDGTALVVAGAYIAYKPIEAIRFGAGFEALTGRLKSRVIFSASPQDRLLAAPESPEYDADSTLTTSTIFAPSGHFGVTAVPAKILRIGVAFHLPMHVDTPAELQITLPRAPAFDGARTEGSDVRVKTVLPAVLRAGIEVRPRDDTRIELAYVREFWNAHRAIEIEPTNLRVFGVLGFPSPFSVPPVSVPRNFRSSHSVRLGGELTVMNDPGVDLRAGIGFERSAVPPAYLSPLTADLDRLTLSIGAGVRPHPRWRIDAVFAHVFSWTEEVDPRTAGVYAINPVRGNPTVPVPINGGTYSNRGNVLGLGAVYTF
jgi:long-chain fatty acid transport protein